MLTILFLLSLVFLFFTKKWLTKELGQVVHLLGGNRNNLIVLWSVIFLPGTVIHELSHFFFAIITGARTGKVEILPEFLEDDEGEDQNVALGYVQTQKLNLIQGFFVGTAPFIVGSIILVWLSSIMFGLLESKNYLAILLSGYLFFTTANSFYPSWSDIKQTIPLVVASAITVCILWITGFELVWRPDLWIMGLFTTLLYSLLASSLINLFLVFLLFLFVKNFRRTR